MFEDLTTRFESVFSKLRGRGTLTEENISEALRDVRRALLEADVNFRVAKKFVEHVREKAVGAQVLRSITPGQQIIKVVQDELTALMGTEAKPIRLHTNRLSTIVMAGLQGSGKTTACAKLALHFRKQGHRPLLVACDTHRAAAIDQLETLGRSLSVPTYADRQKTAPDICRDALAFARREAYTLAIVDTAGRLHIDQAMMDELKQICTIAQPDETLFVADAMTGQDAVNVAAEFHREIAFSGVILTKMDGDARGGAALSILDVTGVPIRFVGTSEKPDGLEVFYPERMASRILGMGDIVTLVEKAQQDIDLEETKRLEKRVRRDQLTLQDFLDQLRQIKKMGSLGDILSMLPGMGAQVKDVDVDGKSLKRIEAAICSMTLEERRRPSIIDGSRRRRIARGSGTTVQEVNRLLKQFDTMKTMLKRMNKIARKRGQSAALRNMVPFQ